MVPVDQVEFLKDVILVSGGHDHTIKLWNPLKMSCIATIQNNESVTIKVFVKYY